jgi:hypothetical protein
MKIVTKEIKENGLQFLVYVMDLANSPLVCDFATNENKTDVVNTLIERFGNIETIEEMSYNEYLNQ